MNLIAKIDALLDKTAFPKVQSTELELKKIGLFRIIFGIIVLVRFSELFYSMSVIGSPKALLIAPFLAIFTAFTFGLFTPITTILLMVGIRTIDESVSTHTLGSTVAIQTALVFFLTNSGQYYSLDRLLTSKNNWISKIIKAPYKLLGTISNNDIRRAYFLGFALIAISHGLAFGFHLHDDYWLKGLTIKSLFSNSFLSAQYEIFRYLENSFPIIISLLSIFGIIVHSFFQLLMFPLIFTKRGVQFVFWWGLIFAFISLISINLSYLPHVEMVLWPMVFLTIKTNRPKLTVLYDKKCNLCQGSIKFLKFINFNGRFDFEGLPIEAPKYIIARKNNKEFKGFDVYHEASKTNPLLWIFIPITFFLKITRIGYAIYNFIAKNRYKIFGVCKLAPPPSPPKKPFQITPIKNFKSYFYGFYITAAIACIIIYAPHTYLYAARHLKWKPIYVIRWPIYQIGFEIPDVFNRNDLGMGDHWVVIHRETPEGDWKLVPMSGPEGQRLNYSNHDILHMTNHNSDYLYFGRTLPYRRRINATKDKINFHAPGQYGFENIKTRIEYDYRLNKLETPTRYKAEVLTSQSSHVKHWVSTPERHIPETLLQFEYTYDNIQLVETNRFISSKLR